MDRESSRTDRALLAFVPAIAVRSAPEGIRIGPWEQRTSAAALFADITGFTLLTERLGREPEGAEQISRILTAYFGEVVETVEAHGGDVLRLAGDAAVALWTAPDPADLRGAVEDAVACGGEILERLDDRHIEGEHVRLRIGIAAGPVRAMHVGGVDGKWEFVVTGRPLAVMGEAQRHAAPGEVVIAATDLGPDPAIPIAPAGDGFVRVLGGGAPRQHGVRPRMAEVTPQLRGYVPDVVLSRLDAGQDDWMAELRRITVLFVGIGGIRADDGDALRRTQDALTLMQEILHRHHGTVRQFMVDEKGMVLIAAFGLPPRVGHDDAVRGMRAALGFRDGLLRLGLDPSIGIATGRAFCGPIGNDRRREYALVGDVVNVAARLRDAAKGSILCDAETFGATRSEIRFRRLPAFVLKGKASPVDVWRTADAHDDGERIVGRVAERGQLDQLLADFRRGTGGVVLVEGEPGVGKSRLVRTFLAALPPDVTVLSSNADPLGAHAPYQAWRGIFGALFAARPSDARAGPEAAIAAIAADEHLARLLPLIGAVFDVDIPDTAVTAEMRGQARADSTNDLLVGLLDRAARQTQLLLTIEDAHWLDASSWTLVGLVADRIPTVGIILTSRPTADPVTQYTQLVEAGARRLALQGLTPSETRELIRDRLSVDDVAVDVAQRVHRQSGGNPLFIEELIGTLRDRHLIVVRHGVCEFAPEADRDALALPDTVQSVMTGRIDQLPATEQLTLKVAAVLASRFSPAVLASVHPIAEQRAQLGAQLERLVRLDLLRRVDQDLDPVYEFRHAIVRDVAYDLLTYAQRRQLHATVATVHEASPQGGGRAHVLLAHHWQAAGNAERARPHVDAAGAHAVRSGAYREAIELIERALDAPAADLTASERELRSGRLERQLAEAYQGLGRQTDGHAHLRAALRHLRHPEPGTLARLAPRILGQVIIQAAHRLAGWTVRHESGAGAKRTIEAARAYIRLVEVHWFANRVPFLLHASLTALNLSERIAAATPERARAYAIMCLGAGSAPAHRLAEMYARRSVDTARTLGRVHALGYALFITSVYLIGTGQWSRVRAALTEAKVLFEEFGDRRLLGDARTVEAMAGLYVGDFGESESGFEAVWRSGVRDDNVQHQVWGLLGRGEILLRRGALQEASEQVRSALLLLARSPDRAEELRAHGLLATVDLALGHRGLAAAERDRAGELIRGFSAPTAHYLLEGYASVAIVSLAEWAEAGGGADPERRRAIAACQSMRRFARIFPIGRPRGELLMARARWLAGDDRRAREHAAAAIHWAEWLGMQYELGLALLELGRRSGPGDRGQRLARAAAIFERIGCPAELAQARAGTSGPEAAATA